MISAINKFVITYVMTFCDSKEKQDEEEPLDKTVTYNTLPSAPPEKELQKTEKNINNEKKEDQDSESEKKEDSKKTKRVPSWEHFYLSFF